MSDDEKNEDIYPVGKIMRKIVDKDDLPVCIQTNEEIVKARKMNEAFMPKNESESNKHKELEEVTKDTKNDGVKNDR